MILGDHEIKKLELGRHIPACSHPFVNPASLNVRIGTTFLIPRRKLFGGVALGDKVQYRRVELEHGKAFKLRPGQFALATTMEKIDLPPRACSVCAGSIFHWSRRIDRAERRIYRPRLSRAYHA